MFRPDSKLMAVLETAADFIALNLLFVIGCLPLIPFGNPLIAAVSVLLNLVPLIWLSRSPAAFLQVSFFWLVAAFSLTAFLITQLLRVQLKKYLDDEKEHTV